MYIPIYSRIVIVALSASANLLTRPNGLRGGTGGLPSFEKKCYFEEVNDCFIIDGKVGIKRNTEWECRQECCGKTGVRGQSCRAYQHQPSNQSSKGKCFLFTDHYVAPPGDKHNNSDPLCLKDAVLNIQYRPDETSCWFKTSYKCFLIERPVVTKYLKTEIQCMDACFSMEDRRNVRNNCRGYQYHSEQSLCFIFVADRVSAIPLIYREKSPCHEEDRIKLKLCLGEQIFNVGANSGMGFR